MCEIAGQTTKKEVRVKQFVDQFTDNSLINSTAILYEITNF